MLETLIFTLILQLKKQFSTWDSNCRQGVSILFVLLFTTKEMFFFSPHERLLCFEQLPQIRHFKRTLRFLRLIRSCDEVSTAMEWFIIHLETVVRTIPAERFRIFLRSASIRPLADLFTFPHALFVSPCLFDRFIIIFDHAPSGAPTAVGGQRYQHKEDDADLHLELFSWNCFGD